MNPSVKINCIELTWVESKEKLAEWENLLIESDFPHPFSSFTFYNAWVETFVDDLTQIKMLFFYNENNLELFSLHSQSQFGKIRGKFS